MSLAFSGLERRGTLLLRTHVFLLALFTMALFLAHSIAHAADTWRYGTASRQIVEARLKRYSGNDTQREETLKKMFAEAGCDELHLSEQAVKGSKLPNVVCTLPGNSRKTIIVGAHYDHVSAGNGVVDNWSGASLLPSLYQAVKSDARIHTYVFVGFADEEKGEIGSHSYARQMSKEEVAATDAW